MNCVTHICFSKISSEVSLLMKVETISRINNVILVLEKPGVFRTLGNTARSFVQFEL